MTPLAALLENDRTAYQIDGLQRAST